MTRLTAATPASQAGLDLTMTGWDAAAAVAIVATALLFWVVCSTQRTTNLTRIIQALRGTDTRPPRPAPRTDRTLTK